MKYVPKWNINPRLIVLFQIDILLLIIAYVHFSTDENDPLMKRETMVKVGRNGNGNGKVSMA
jgi:hypothetical protein